MCSWSFCVSFLVMFLSFAHFEKLGYLYFIEVQELLLYFTMLIEQDCNIGNDKVIDHTHFGCLKAKSPVWGNLYSPVFPVSFSKTFIVTFFNISLFLLILIFVMGMLVLIFLWFVMKYQNSLPLKICYYHYYYQCLIFVKDWIYFLKCRNSVCQQSFPDCSI